MELSVEDEGKGCDELQSNILRIRHNQFETLWLVIENFVYSEVDFW